MTSVSEERRGSCLSCALFGGLGSVPVTLLGQVSLHLITTEAWLDETKTGVPDWWSRVISIVIVSLFRTGYIAPSLVVASPLWQARCRKQALALPLLVLWLPQKVPRSGLCVDVDWEALEC